MTIEVIDVSNEEDDAAMEAHARWAAATVILSYMGKLGVTSAAGDCPHCGCCLLYLHEPIPYREVRCNFFAAYECVRCGATFLLGDVHPHVADYLDKAMRPR